jgi:hypothetical protein
MVPAAHEPPVAGQRPADGKHTFQFTLVSETYLYEHSSVA